VKFNYCVVLWVNIMNFDLSISLIRSQAPWLFDQFTFVNDEGMILVEKNGEVVYYLSVFYMDDTHVTWVARSAGSDFADAGQADDISSALSRADFFARLEDQASLRGEVYVTPPEYQDWAF
jgi:hypothetical protein